MSLAGTPNYRTHNLYTNSIFIRDPDEEFPDSVANLVRELSKGRNSPEPSPDEVGYDKALSSLDKVTVNEADVGNYFRTHVFPATAPLDNLQLSFRSPMYKDTVPIVNPSYKVTNPVPDAAYGYNLSTAFPQQLAQLVSMGDEPLANTQQLVYPFFVIEFKSNGGNLWAATNQCVGACVSSINIAERLNERLEKCGGDKALRIDSTVFSAAINASEARLYVSWKQDELGEMKYYMQRVKYFCIQDPDQYILFRRYVRNIIDWGKNERLNDIRNSLDVLMEQNWQIVSKAAKSRQPRFDGSRRSSTTKHES
jgi:hypothetical protein